MKPETVFATMMMVVGAVVAVVFVSGALAMPGTNSPPARVQPAQDQPVLAPTRPPLQVTSVPGLPSDAGTRDATRLSDLQAIAAALQSYHDKRNTYPNTSSNVQTACVFQTLDKLCEIKNEVGAQRLADVRGADFGYWYSSDGKTFTLYASLEGAPDGSDPCPRTASLIKAANVFCLNSYSGSPP